jgi:ABC-type multidrug transport system fused ATPase/permease subunit
LSGHATVLLVTHRPSHMRCADRVVVLDRGQIAADGPPDEIVPVILAQMQEKKVS